MNRAIVSIATIGRFNFSSGIPTVVDNDLYQYAIRYHSLCNDNGYLATGYDYRNGELLMHRGALPYSSECDSGFQESVQAEAVSMSPIETISRSATNYVQIAWASKTSYSLQALPVILLCE